MGDERPTIRIVAAPPDSAPPLELDAVVIEDDTYLVLGADPVAKEEYERGDRLVRRAAATDPKKPGTVVVEEGSPQRYLAVVHDLDLEPSWREEWVAAALGGLMREVGARRHRSIALPMLGTLHGTLEPRRFVELLRQALDDFPPDSLESIWLIVPWGTRRGLLDRLEGYDCEVRGSG